MSLEDYVAALNGNIFLREFSFAKNTFSPAPGQEVEFADHVIWIDNLLMVYQLKERSDVQHPSEDSEKKWFDKKVLKKAREQVRDTLNYLESQQEISITNQRGHVFDVNSKSVSTIIKIVIHAPNEALPEVCWNTKHYISSTAGFIHIVPIHDYLGICQVLVTPAEIAEYFEFREKVIRTVISQRAIPTEQALVGQFISGLFEETPGEEYQEYLNSLKNDIDEFDIQFILNNFSDRITYIGNQGVENDYYSILQEFAKLNRSELREVKRRIKLSLEACDADEFELPYRIVVPRTGCGFVFIPNDREQMKYRLIGLQNFTYAAKYDQKLEKQIGISFAKEGSHFLIDWCFMSFPWQYDREMEQRLRTSFPFREVREQRLNRYKGNQ